MAGVRSGRARTCDGVERGEGSGATTDSHGYRARVHGARSGSARSGEPSCAGAGSERTDEAETPREHTDGQARALANVRAYRARKRKRA